MKDEHPFDIWRRENADKLKQADEDGTYSAVLRTGEISVVSKERAFNLCQHHAFQAAVELRQFRGIVSQAPDTSEQMEREGVLYSLPQYLRDRLDPVFSRQDVFDPQGCYQKKFDDWVLIYSALFSLAQFSPSEGYQRYISQFNESMEVVTGIIDDMRTDLKREVCL